MRFGDWIQDPRNYDCKMKAGASEIEYAEIFDPIEIYGKALVSSGFREESIDGQKAYYCGEKDYSVVIRQEGDSWFLRIIGKYIYQGAINFIHELQHALLDCHIDIQVKLR